MVEMEEIVYELCIQLLRQPSQDTQVLVVAVEVLGRMVEMDI